MRYQNEAPSDRIETGHGQNVLMAVLRAYPQLAKSSLAYVWGLGRKYDLGQERRAASVAIPNVLLSAQGFGRELDNIPVNQPPQDTTYDFMTGRGAMNLNDAQRGQMDALYREMATAANRGKARYPDQF